MGRFNRKAMQSHCAIVQGLALNEDEMLKLYMNLFWMKKGSPGYGLLKHLKNSSFLTIEKMMIKKLNMLPMGS
nr:hypothetical protein [Tanacetum cinerariifolium]